MVEGKKICFLCPWMNVEGGLQRVVTNLANRMAEIYEVTICVISVNQDSPYYVLDGRITIDYLPSAAYGNQKLCNKVVGKFLRNFKVKEANRLYEETYYPPRRVHSLENYLKGKQYDVVIAVCGDISLLLSYVDKGVVKSKFIGWQHNSYEDYFCKKGFYYFGREKIASIHYKNLDALVTLTKKDSEIYKNRMGINAISIYNPLTFNGMGSSNVESHIILFVGRLDWVQKGLEHLIQIIYQISKEADLRDWKVIVAGDGTDRIRFENEIAKLNLSNRIQMLGKINNVKDYYQKASILLNTSNWEGFGLVITEAFECGVPVVAFETDGPSEIIENGKNGFLIEKYNETAFSKSVIQLMRDEKLRQRFSENAKKRAKEFGMEQIIVQWKHLIEE